jgi:hypothetical protein
MIFRFSQKLGSRLKAGPLKPLPLEDTPVADWTSHVFFFDRTPYVLTSNTATLYSTVLYAKGITNDSVFIVRLLSALREFMEADGLAFAYDRFIAPRTGVIRFASTFSRSVTGSMNELVAYAKVILADEETSPFGLGFRLNDLLLSAVASDASRNYGKPRDAFQAVVARSKAPIKTGTRTPTPCSP